MDKLTHFLLDLLDELRGGDARLLIGGGFGLFLKRRFLAAAGERTLFQELPAPRATNDLDIFLRAELLCDLQRMQAIRDAILRLGYTPVEEARFLQWKRSVMVAGAPREVKLDFLVGPLGASRRKLNVKSPRVRPKGKIEFHAHQVEEAVSLEESPFRVEVEGRETPRANRAARRSTCLTPSPICS